MMKNKVKIFLFSDALGYEIVTKYKFMEEDFPYRQKAETQLGYSATAVPTILCGEAPTVHGHLSFFYFAKDGNSPFKIFKYLKYFMYPKFFFNHHRVRHKISQIFQKITKWDGYFSLYQMPWNRLPLFDYCEKNDIYSFKGLYPAKNIRDMLEKSPKKYHISNWRKSDENNLLEAQQLLAKEEYDFLFIYNGSVDGMLHFHVNDSAYVKKYLEEYSKDVKKVLKTAQSHYKDVSFYIMSDHGMTPLKQSIDLKQVFENGQYKFRKDYIVVYDSTMLRYWAINSSCKEELMNRLKNYPGHWLSNEEKQKFNLDFADSKYGDEIFLTNPGVQIAPSDMGKKAIPGMHGYTPKDKDSNAAILSNKPIPIKIEKIADFFKAMEYEAYK